MATIMSWAEPSPHILAFFKAWVQILVTPIQDIFQVATWATRTQILGAQHQFLGAMGYWATVSVYPCW